MNRLLFSLLIFTLVCISSKAQPKHEIRAVWLTTNYALDWPSKPVRSISDITNQKKELCKILDELKDCNFNVVFFQARLRGSVLYPSKIEPWSNYVSNSSNSSPGYDPLAFAIEACHERGLECHVWFVTYPLGQDNKKKKTTNITLEKNKSMAQNHLGEWYLDPGNPKTNDYLLSLVNEIVEKYDIDGFHFDYIRYPDKAFKFPDQSTFNKYGQKSSLNNWRRENINHFVYSAYDQIKALKPWVQVSSSVLGMYQRIPECPNAGWTAYETVFQDPADWLKNGKHDFIVPMMYYTDNYFFPFIHDWVEKGNGRFILPGIGVYRLDKAEGNWDAETIVKQIAYSRENHTQGNAFYRTKFLLDNRKGILDEITSKFYTTPSQLPPLTWLDSIPPSQALKPEAIREGDHLLLSWENNTESNDEKIFYSIYRSDQYPVDTENAANLVAARISENQSYIYVDNMEKESGYYYVITASDRYHNEGIASKTVFFCTGPFEK